MDIRIPIFLLVLFRYLLLTNEQDQLVAKTKLVCFACFLLILEAGFEHACVGSDTAGYYGSFLDSMGNSWSRVFSGLFVGAEEFRDPGFPIIRKLFQTFIPSWQLWLMALSILFFVGLGKLWNRYIETMEGVLFATTMFLALFNIIVLSGQRQQITMALSMYMIPYLEDKRWKVVVPTVILGSLIHVSFLFFLAFIPLSYLNHKKLKSLLGISILLIPFIAISSRGIVAFMASRLGNDYYMHYAESERHTNTYTYIILCSLASLFLFVFHKHLIQGPKFLSSAAVLMTLTVPLIYLDGSMIRIGQYFTIYMMMSVPFIINRTFGKEIYWLLILVLCVLALLSHFEYHFFWETVNGFEVVAFGEG